MRRKDRLLRSAAIVTAAAAMLFALLSTAWYCTAYRAYEPYMAAGRQLSDWREETLRGAGSDAEGYSFNVKRPDFLSWTGNLGVGLPNKSLPNGEELLYTDSLILWPNRRGGTLGVILYEYTLQENGVACAGHQLYIDGEGRHIPGGDAAEDAANAELLEEHRESVLLLLKKARELWGVP